MTIYEVKLKCKENKKGFLIASVFPTNPEEEMPIELPKKNGKNMVTRTFIAYIFKQLLDDHFFNHSRKF